METSWTLEESPAVAADALNSPQLMVPKIPWPIKYFHGDKEKCIAASPADTQSYAAGGPGCGCPKETPLVIVSRVSDAVVYVLRMDYSHKDDITFMNRVVAEGKLENVSVVINGENNKKKHHYASRSRYIGYGYGDSVYGNKE